VAAELNEEEREAYKELYIERNSIQAELVSIQSEQRQRETIQ
jgi:hypothetical protein